MHEVEVLTSRIDGGGGGGGGASKARHQGWVGEGERAEAERIWERLGTGTKPATRMGHWSAVTEHSLLGVTEQGWGMQVEGQWGWGRA